MTELHCPECHVILRRAGEHGEAAMCPLCHGWIVAITGMEDVLYVSHEHMI